MFGLVAGPCAVAWKRSASVIVVTEVVATRTLWPIAGAAARPSPTRRGHAVVGSVQDWNTIVRMTATQDLHDGPTPETAHVADRGARDISVLLYSNDAAVRDSVRLSVGDQPAADVHVARWHECATPAAVLSSVREEDFDVLVLDGEAQPYGGMGVCRELKNEIFDCPPVVLLTGRPVDGWLATWSLADAAVPRPLDPQRLAAAVVDLVHR